MSENEVYCSSFGKNINPKAEIFPHCGARQIKNTSQTPYALNLHVYELQKFAGKNQNIAVILSSLITPLGYVYIEGGGLALISFITLNYLLLGSIIVLAYIYSMTLNARKERNAIGVGH